MRLLSTLIGGFLLLVTAGGALAQQDQQDQRFWGPAPPGGWPAPGSQITVFRAPDFKGPSVTLNTPQQDLRLGWKIRSVQVRSGNWQLCPMAGYRGDCAVATRNVADLASLGLRGDVSSLRPIRPGSPGGPGGPGGPGWPGGPGKPGQSGLSATGMSTAFYRSPMDRGGRVDACRRGQSNAACAKSTADQFCRDQGYSNAQFQLIETVGRRAYLADVLCLRGRF